MADDKPKTPKSPTPAAAPPPRPAREDAPDESTRRQPLPVFGKAEISVSAIIVVPVLIALVATGRVTSPLAWAMVLLGCGGALMMLFSAPGSGDRPRPVVFWGGMTLLGAGLMIPILFGPV